MRRLINSLLQRRRHMACKQKVIVRCISVLTLLGLCSCSSASQVLNPFYEPPAPIALQGQANDHALGGDGHSKAETARHALEQMGTYQKAHSPQPVNPVLKPAVVRLMWIPDHLNSNGDLVPAHYYYLKVKSDQWAVQDSFELEKQLGGSGRGSSDLPFVYEGSRNVSK